VMFFVMLTGAATLFPAGITTIETASQAAEALRPFAGDAAYLLFTIAIIGTGLLAVPVLAGSAGYAVAEAFGWQASLAKRVGEAKGFYAVIALATLAGLLMSFSGIAPFRMLFYSAVLNGVLAPPLMVLIIILSSDRSVMGKLVNTKRTQVFAWIITGFMTLAALALFASFFL
jgi:Mn2+/Fe2+ NRAMP family transporter